MPNWFIKDFVICKKLPVVACTLGVHPLESIDNIRGLSPGSGFLSVADMSITVLKGDVKHNQPASREDTCHAGNSDVIKILS